MRRFVAILTLLSTACSDAGVTKFNTDPTAEISSHANGDTVRDGYAVKESALRLAVDAAVTVLRVDQIIMSKPAGGPKK